METNDTGLLVTWGSIGAALVTILWGMFKGLISKSITEIDTRFGRIDERLDGIEGILQKHDTHLAVLQREVEQLMLSREKLETAIDSIKDLIRRELSKASFQIAGRIHELREEVASIKDLEDDKTQPR